jgi:hypothetical protein
MRAITCSIILAALAVASTTSAKPKPKTAVVEPQALEALRKMSTFLGGQKNFTVQTKMETDYVIEGGQKVRLSSRGDLRVQRPSRLRATVVSDRKEREFFYDGSTFTLYSPKLRYYATLPAPGTIIELADLLSEQYGVELPLVDLFRWSGGEADFSKIKGAKFIGTSELGGVPTDQYAFHQDGVDWQIWIEHGARPLPRKLLVTTTDDPARPEHSITMDWLLGAQHQQSMFTFTPPKDAMKIAIAEVGVMRFDTKRQAKRSARR